MSFRDFAFHQALSSRSLTVKVGELYESGSIEEARQLILAACDEAERSCAPSPDFEEKLQELREWFRIHADIERYLAEQTTEVAAGLLFRLRGLSNSKWRKPPAPSAPLEDTAP